MGEKGGNKWALWVIQSLLFLRLRGNPKRTQTVFTCVQNTSAALAVVVRDTNYHWSELWGQWRPSYDMIMHSSRDLVLDVSWLPSVSSVRCHLSERLPGRKSKSKWCFTINRLLSFTTWTIFGLKTVWNKCLYIIMIKSIFCFYLLLCTCKCKDFVSSGRFLPLCHLSSIASPAGANVVLKNACSTLCVQGQSPIDRCTIFPVHESEVK